MKNERIGNYYRLFTLKINGVMYYLIGRRNEKGFSLLYDKSEKAVEMFELLEKQRENEK